MSPLRVSRLLLALSLLCGFSGSAAAESFVWKITSPGGSSIYLAGSVHLLSADYYPLAPAYEQAFDAADLLVEELDMAEMLEPGSQMKMLQRGMLPRGQSLDRQLSAEALAAVTKAVNGLGLPFEPLKQFKAWMLAITLQATAWEQAGFDEKLGLDLHFFEKAKAAGKAVQGLETLDFQLSRFDEMTPAVQERLLLETLKELETTERSFIDLANAWKAGDVARLERQIVDDIQSEPEMYERLLVGRNRLWLPKIEALFTRGRPAFVVVGAAHMVGKDGLLEMLRARGYSIAQQ